MPNIDEFIEFAQRRFGEELSRELCGAIQEEFKGENIYINKDIDHRNKMIRDCFTGNNHQELADQFGLCKRQIYRIVNE